MKVSKKHADNEASVSMWLTIEFGMIYINIYKVKLRD